MRSGMSSVDPGVKLGAVDEHNQRGKEGLGAHVLKSLLPGSPLSSVQSLSRVRLFATP